MAWLEQRDSATIEHKGNYTAEDKMDVAILLADLMSARTELASAQTAEQRASEAFSGSLIGRVVRVYGKAHCFGPAHHPVAQLSGARDPIDVEIFVTNFGLGEGLTGIYIEGLTSNYEKVLGEISENHLAIEPIASK